MTKRLNRTTLSGISPYQLIELQKLALDVIGERSVSALIRHIADNGYLSLTESGLGLQLIVPIAEPQKGKKDAQ